MSLSPTFSSHHLIAPIKPILHNPYKKLHEVYPTKTSVSYSCFSSIKLHQSPKTLDSRTSLSTLVEILCQSQNLNDALYIIHKRTTNFSCNSVQIYEGVSLLIQSCGQQENTEVGREVHKIVSSYFGDDHFLNSRLITMYSLCRSPVESRNVFDELKVTKNLFIWNAMISAYTKNELYYDAMLLFSDLVSVSGLKPDNFTLPCVIKSCALLLDIGLGEAIHGLAVKLGFVKDVFVGNALIMMYGKYESVGDALRVFMNLGAKNLVSWNSLIRVYSENGFYEECFELFVMMLEDEEQCVPDVATLVTVLPICAGGGNVEMGMMIHGLAVKLGLRNESAVNNALMDMYAKCEFSFASRKLFESNRFRNTVSWNSIIWNYSKQGFALKTFDLLREMQTEGGDIKVNDVTILNVLPVFVNKSQLMSLKELHSYTIRHGFLHGELLANAFIVAYAKCESVTSAYSVFRNIGTKTVNSWNAMIDGYAQKGDPKKAVDLYLAMTTSNVSPDLFTMSILLLACSELRLFRSGKEIHGFVIRNWINMDSFISVSLISFYFHCDKSDFARAIFHRIENRSSVSWNAMISGYSQVGRPVEAINICRDMLLQGVNPDEIAITSLLGACSQLSYLRLGKEIHCHTLRAYITQDEFLTSSIIDMYAKCGCLELSSRFFDSLTEKVLESYNVMISGYGIHGHVNEALSLLKQMQRSGLKPDHFTLIGILVACSHAGLVGEGLEYFNNMHSLYGIRPKLQHYACVVDMLARAGRIDDALELVQIMPMETDTKIWSSVLNSCRIHGNMAIGRLAAEKLLKLEPDRVENYIQVSNLFAQSGKWDDVRVLRGKMKEKGLQKEAGCSWVEAGGKIYAFVVGDYMLPESEEIREMWLRLEKKIKNIGYIPDTSSVLHDLREEEKLDLLRGHSEKLAVSFGLLKTGEGMTLRVSKNLRICADCHNAIKLVSKIVNREIVVRDNKRFHHFKNGGCSCGDYW